MFLRVAEFHRVFGQYIADVPAFPDQRIRDLRMRLLQEEYNEFCDAYANNDLVEMADGLADMCYIIAGTCVSYGICPDEPIDYPYEEIIKQVDLFIHKPLNDVLGEVVAKYEIREAANDLEEVKTQLMLLMSAIFGVALHLGLPLKTVFAEVHRSNMSKVEEDGLPRYREDGKLLKGSRYSPPDIRAILYPQG